MRKTRAIFVAAALLSVSLIPNAQAAVEVPCDSAALVGAIYAANARARRVTLHLARGCLYELAAEGGRGVGLPVMVARLRLRGNGATIARSSASGTGDFTVIKVAAGARVSISNLTIVGGRAPQGVSGGGIINQGLLTLAKVTVSGNQAGNGASANQGGHGGGIFNDVGAVLKTTRLELSGNYAGSGGEGPIDGDSGGYGGGVYNAGSMILKGYVHSNMGGTGGRGDPHFGHYGPGGFGGGVFNAADAKARITARVTGNSGGGGDSGYAAGGGIYNDSYRIRVKRGTVKDNIAQSPTNCAPAGSVIGCGSP